jgi:hypothetical protein
MHVEMDKSDHCSPVKIAREESAREGSGKHPRAGGRIGQQMGRCRPIVIRVGRFDCPMILARRALSCPARAACGPQLSHAAKVPGYSTDNTCAQTTIIPTNRVMDANAAASSTTARIMLLSPW